MAAFVPEKVYGCFWASSVPKISALPDNSYTSSKAVRSVDGHGWGFVKGRLLRTLISTLEPKETSNLHSVPSGSRCTAVESTGSISAES